MGAWDAEILNGEINEDFLEELSTLEGDDVVEGVMDAVLLVSKGNAETEQDIANGECAATIAAIWMGAPYSSSDATQTYEFIVDPGVEIADDVVEELTQAASEVLENSETELDLDAYIEALN